MTPGPTLYGQLRHYRCRFCLARVPAWRWKAHGPCGGRALARLYRPPHRRRDLGLHGEARPPHYRRYL